MKKIVIIGNSAAGIAAAEAIRDKNKESSLTIVTSEPFLAYERSKLLDFLEGKTKEQDLYFRNQDFYKNNAIELILGKEVVALNISKKKVIFKEKDFVDFDALIIAAGCRVPRPAIKGTQKEGVVTFNSLSDAKFLVENLPIAHTVVMVGSDRVAVALARLIAAKKIEVKFFGSLSEPIPGVDVISDNPITEILGDSDAKAVRLSNNKVIGASIIIFTSPRKPCINFLEGAEIKKNKGILVDAQMCTNIPFVYAAGDVCEFTDKEKICNWQNAQLEGQIVGGIVCQT